MTVFSQYPFISVGIVQEHLVDVHFPPMGLVGLIDSRYSNDEFLLGIFIKNGFHGYGDHGMLLM